MNQPDHNRDQLVWNVFIEQPNAPLTRIAQRCSEQAGVTIGPDAVSNALTRIFRIQMGARKHDVLTDAK